MFTPESSMEIQRKLGSDIIMAFDDCPPGDSDHSTIKKSVERTTNWMVRCSDWLEKNQNIMIMNRLFSHSPGSNRLTT